jgi:redox-sensitive bicupin YhaK (pirin superfamily)
MLTLRAAAERGHFDHGWLETWHSFSFADYHDPAHLRFGPLRVLNEDIVQPGRGFETHGHRDMEILTWILEGALEHRDSMGNGSVIVPGDVQRMSAGRGVLHSEFNPSREARVHLLQIWIHPELQGIEPSYEQTRFPTDERRGRLRLVASPDGALGSVRIRQQARVYAGLFDGDEQARLPLVAGRRADVHVARGSIEVNGTRIGAGDALRIESEAAVELARGTLAEVLVLDLP